MGLSLISPFLSFSVYALSHRGPTNDYNNKNENNNSNAKAIIANFYKMNHYPMPDIVQITVWYLAH